MFNVESQMFNMLVCLVKTLNVHFMAWMMDLVYFVITLLDSKKKYLNISRF